MDTVQIQRILLPTDFSDSSSAANGYACALASSLGAELHLLYVFEHYTGSTYVPGLPIPEATSQIEEEKQKVAESLAHLLDAGWAADHRVTRATREGDPFVEIVRYAREQSIDMVVMGTHGRTGLAHLFMGSVAENVVRQCHCPVLTVHPSDHKFELA